MSRDDEQFSSNPGAQADIIIPRFMVSNVDIRLNLPIEPVKYQPQPWFEDREDRPDLTFHALTKSGLFVDALIRDRPSASIPIYPGAAQAHHPGTDDENNGFVMK